MADSSVSTVMFSVAVAAGHQCKDLRVVGMCRCGLGCYIPDCLMGLGGTSEVIGALQPTEGVSGFICFTKK